MKEMLAVSVPLALWLEREAKRCALAWRKRNRKRQPAQRKFRTIGSCGGDGHAGARGAERSGQARTCTHHDAAEIQSCGSHDQLTGGGTGARQRDGEGRIGGIGNDGNASRNIARRIRSKGHTEGEALPWDQGEWQAQSAYTKGSAGKI